MLYSIDNTYNEDIYTISLLEDVDVLLSNIDNNTITDRIEYNLAYNYCNSLIEQYITTGNDEYIDMIVLDEITRTTELLNRINRRNQERLNQYIADHPEADSSDKNLLRLSTNAKMSDFRINAQNTFGALGDLDLNKMKQNLDSFNNSYADAAVLNQDRADTIARFYGKKANDKLAKKAVKYGLAPAALVAGSYLAYKKRDKIKDKLNKARIGAYHLVGKQIPEEIKVQQEKEEQEKARLAQQQNKQVQQQMEHIKQIAENKPKSWIGKKIQALRSLYSNYLNKARQAHNAGQSGIFQNIARIILNCIDWLMNKLQHMAG